MISLGPAILAAALYIGVAAVELPGVWKSAGQRRTFWVVLGLYLFGLGLAMAVASGAEPMNPLMVIDAIFRPIGEPFLKPAKG